MVSLTNGDTLIGTFADVLR